MLKTKPRFEIDETTAQSAQLPGSKWLFVPGGIVAIAAWYLVYRQLASLADWLAFSLFGLNISTHLGSAVLRLPLIAVFVGVVATGIVIVGYVFNFIM